MPLLPIDLIPSGEYDQPNEKPTTNSDQNNRRGAQRRRRGLVANIATRATPWLAQG